MRFKILRSLLPIFFAFSLVTAYGDDSPRKKLTQAISSGDLLKVQTLIESKQVGVDDPSDEYSTLSPLVEAASYAQIPIVKYLVSKGAFIEGISKNGSTPLTKLIESGGTKLSFQNLMESVQFLIDSGANVNYLGEDGTTPLMNACKCTRSIELVEMLLDLRALIDIQSKDENTAFLHALRSNNIKAARLLLSRGANTRIVCKGMSPLSLFAWEGNIIAAQYLIEEVKMDVNERDSDGTTPIICAALGAQSSMIKFLVEKGGNINAKTISPINVKINKNERWPSILKSYVTFPKGCTALNFAKHFNYHNAINMICDLGGVEYQEINLKEWTSWH